MQITSLPQLTPVLDLILNNLRYCDITRISSTSKHFNSATQRFWKGLAVEKFGDADDINNFGDYYDVYCECRHDAEYRPSITYAITRAVKKERMDIVKRLIKSEGGLIQRAFYEAGKYGKTHLFSHLWSIKRQTKSKEKESKIVSSLVLGCLISMTGITYELDRFVRQIERPDIQLSIIADLAIESSFMAIPYILQSWGNEECIRNVFSTSGYVAMSEKLVLVGPHTNYVVDNIRLGWCALRKLIETSIENIPDGDDHSLGIVTHMIFTSLMRMKKIEMIIKLIDYAIDNLNSSVIEIILRSFFISISYCSKQRFIVESGLKRIMVDPLILVCEQQSIRIIERHCYVIASAGDRDLIDMYLEVNDDKPSILFLTELLSHPDLALYYNLS